MIAKEDLKLRGAGDFFGRRQHGLPSLAMADLFEDTGLFNEAQGAARALLDSDPSLSNPENALLKTEIERMFSANESALN